jgi:hypothetical protein
MYQWAQTPTLSPRSHGHRPCGAKNEEEEEEEEVVLMRHATRHELGLRLLAEGLLLGLVLGAWLWWVVALGAHAADVQQTSSPRSEIVHATYGIACPASGKPAADDEGAGCRGKAHPGVGTSRVPGRGDIAERDESSRR